MYDNDNDNEFGAEDEVSGPTQSEREQLLALSKEVCKLNEKKKVLLAGLMLSVAELGSRDPTFDVHQKLVFPVNGIIAELIGMESAKKLVTESADLASQIHSKMQLIRAGKHLQPEHLN